jgi:hypothetical protein
MTGAVLVIAFVVLIGPLSYFYGADSRPTHKRDRNWRPAHHR